MKLMSAAASDTPKAVDVALRAEINVTLIQQQPELAVVAAEQLGWEVIVPSGGVASGV